MMSLLDIAFPYRVRRTFGITSLALVFVLLLAEVEALVFVALAVVAHRLDLFWELQPVLLPGACFISLTVAAVFTWRARTWSQHRVATLEQWAGTGTGFAEKLATKRARGSAGP